MPNSPRSPILARNRNVPVTEIAGGMPLLNSPRSPKTSPRFNQLNSPRPSKKMSISNKLKKKK